jgi:hypothetical protein
MSSNTESDLASFYRFVGIKLDQKDAKLSPEDVLDEWRAEHPAHDDETDDVMAVKQALADMAAGDQGRPWEEFDREFRQRHGLS